jgi:imidazolonepropionase-like amidohydrolase
MKIIYIATAINERGDTIQENAYMDAEQALAQAKKMCDDIHRNTDMQVIPDAMPIELFEVGDVVPEPAIGTD